MNEARRLPQRRQLPHSVPSWVSDDAVFFITVCCEPRGLNQLCATDKAGALFDTVEFRQRRGDWFVHLLLLMPDHVHALMSFPKGGDMKATLTTWKEFTAKSIPVVWQRGFFDHRLRGSESHREKASYIRMNPVRRGLADSPDAWPYVWEGKVF
jgi:putative transposase